MSRLEMPCLLLHGLEDIRSESHHTINLYEAATSRDKTLKLYEGEY